MDEVTSEWGDNPIGTITDAVAELGPPVWLAHTLIYNRISVPNFRRVNP